MAGAFNLLNMLAETMDITARLGIIQKLILDSGSNFVSKTMKYFCTLTWMKQIKISPYHPKTDRMMKRFNSMLKWSLRKLVTNPEAEWDDCLPYVLWAHWESIHMNTGSTHTNFYLTRK